MSTVDLIVPAYNESAVIDQFFQAVLAVLDTIPDWEGHIILINDGSRDDTLQRALVWQERDSRVEILDLSRNFGHEAALSAGLAASSGDVAIVMDADLQDPPELIAAMLQRHREGFDVVNAHRRLRRSDTFMKRLTAAGFYRVINSLSGKIRIPENVGNYRLISRRVVQVLNQLPEKNRVFRVLVPYLGFTTCTVEYERPPRPAGSTHYNYRSMVRLAIDGIASATTIPLQFAIRLGLVVSALGFAYLVWVLFEALILKTTISGWASTMSAILFLGGIQLVFLGVLGEYLGRIFQEVKGRPDHIIAARYRNGKQAGVSAPSDKTP